MIKCIFKITTYRLTCSSDERLFLESVISITQLDYRWYSVQQKTRMYHFLPQMTLNFNKADVAVATTLRFCSSDLTVISIKSLIKYA